MAVPCSICTRGIAGHCREYGCLHDCYIFGHVYGMPRAEHEAFIDLAKKQHAQIGETIYIKLPSLKTAIR